jgi:hypothetical protein
MVHILFSTQFLLFCVVVILLLAAVGIFLFLLFSPLLPETGTFVLELLHPHNELAI